MKPGGGRAKGSAFERDVSKRIVTAFSSFGITQEDCYRTPMSGGHRYAKQCDPGDHVISTRLVQLFPFGTECKSYAKLQWHELLATIQPSSHWARWWKQCTAAIIGKPTIKPLLIFKQNRSIIYCMFRSDDVPFSSHIPRRIRTELNQQPLTVCSFEYFLRKYVSTLKR